MNTSSYRVLVLFVLSLFGCARRENQDQPMVFKQTFTIEEIEHGPRTSRLRIRYSQPVPAGEYATALMESCYAFASKRGVKYFALLSQKAIRATKDEITVGFSNDRNVSPFKTFGAECSDADAKWFSVKEVREMLDVMGR